MGSIPDLCHDLKSRYPLLSYESVTKKDGSDYILIRSSLPEISRYLPHLNAVVESGVVKLLSYHGKILKEENFAGGIILEQLNEGKLFFCIGVGSLREGLEDSALKEVFSEPSTDGDIVYRSRSCSFFLEDTPGICYNCQMFLESLHKVQEDRSEETTVWLKEEDYFEEEDDDSNDYHVDIWEEPAEILSEEEEDSPKAKKSTVTPKLQFVCQICSRKFSSKYSYDRHYRQHTSVKDDSSDFEEENESNDKDSDVEEAEKILSGEKEECPKCEKIYEESTLNDHLKNCPMKMKQLDSKRIKTCKICLRSFSKDCAYRRHCNRHTVRINLDESIDCPLCKKCLDNRKCLNDHIHESHDSSKGCCVICFKLMPKDTVYKHMDKNHGYKKHLCPECGQKFKFPYELKYHIDKHHDMGGDKFVVCDECGRRQPHHRALVKHKWMCHNKSNEYPCKTCNKVFYTRSRLTQHIPLHFAVKPFKCSFCTYSCARKDNVRLHIRRVHKKEPSREDVITITSPTATDNST